MRARSRYGSILASGLLALSLLNASATVASEPSADDPASTVNGMLDTLVAKDFAGIGAFVCAERRSAAVERFDLEASFAALGEGVDVRTLFASLTVTNPDRTVEVTANDGATATVAVGGSIQLEVDDAAAREFTRQLLEAQGLEATDALLDEYTPQLVAGIERPQDLTDTLTVIVEDGVWLVCDDLLAGDSPSATPAPSAGPLASTAPMDPAAYAALLAAVPEPLVATCEPDPYWQVAGLPPEPGEIAEAFCDPDDHGGLSVSYSLFDSPEAMSAFYDVQLEGYRRLGGLDGPGCPEGPGETTWEHGRRFCYDTFIGDANMRWTHDALSIVANAIEDDGDWAALEAFFASAGPVAP